MFDSAVDADDIVNCTIIDIIRKKCHAHKTWKNTNIYNNSTSHNQQVQSN